MFWAVFIMAAFLVLPFKVSTRRERGGLGVAIVSEIESDKFGAFEVPRDNRDV